ncbi:MAG: HEAT repeat domain-containing protein [Armatimonadetes bacterium]|nr:HEAT repeat domain-containing protein [Anaerolineae bacterium]
MVEPTIDDYIANLRSAKPDVRRNAAWTLGRSRDIRILLPLITALNDPDADVRVRVAEALGNLRDARAVEPLLAALSHESDEEVQTQLLRSLGRQGDVRALDALLDALHAPSAMIRGAAAEALHDIPDSRATPLLAHTLAHDIDESVRSAAYRALTRIGGTPATDTLVAMLMSDLPADARNKIAELLGVLGERSTEPVLRMLLDDPDEGVRDKAAWALRQMIHDDNEA